MAILPFRLSRRSITIAASLVGLVSLGLGAHAALNKRVPETGNATEVASGSPSDTRDSRLALVIGNGHYPDAGTALNQPINDARALTGALRRDGFDVDVVEDATRDDMIRAVERLKSRIKPDSVVMLFFGGFGIEAGRESYMIPVDATIWREADVRRNGLSVESVLAAMQERGARAKLAVIDASRRNPYERRFRGFSHGLAPISAPNNALILSSATPGKVADDSDGASSLLVSELIGALGASGGAEAAFKQTKLAVSRATDGQQVPSLSSSLSEDLNLAPSAEASAEKPGS